MIFCLSLQLVIMPYSCLYLNAMNSDVYQAVGQRFYYSQHIGYVTQAIFELLLHTRQIIQDQIILQKFHLISSIKVLHVTTKSPYMHADHAHWDKWFCFPKLNELFVGCFDPIIINVSYQK